MTSEPTETANDIEKKGANLPVLANRKGATDGCGSLSVCAVLPGSNTGAQEGPTRKICG